MGSGSAVGGVPAGCYGRAAVLAPTAGQAAALDHDAISRRGVPQAALMENAGRQAALLVEHLLPRGRVVGLVGSGNNGGDALVALRTLAAWGREVAALPVGRRSAGEGVLHGWEIEHFALGSGKADVASVAAVLAGAGVLLDGLLGTGASGAPRDDYADLIRAANGSAAARVSLDAPSGVDCTSGRVPGESVNADVTVAFGWPKLGTLLHPARERCGRIVAVEIGFPPGGAEGWARVVTPGWATAHSPRRSADTHKNEVGALALVAGADMPGAAVLAARSAYRCGAGLVRVCAARESRKIVASVPEAIFVDAADDRALQDAVERSAALAIGPGIGTGGRARRQLEAALGGRGARPAVIDADALTLLADGGRFAASHLAGCVVTPHPGEMARLLGRPVAEIQSDRIAAATGFARSQGVATLLKGTPSIVAGPEGEVLIAAHEQPSALAVAGMGDVLTGAVGSLLAQGVAPVTAAGLALHLTGAEATRDGLGPALTPSDAIEAIPRALAARGPGATDLPFPFVTFDQRPPRHH